MAELRLTRRQFWIPAFVAAFLIFGLPVLYAVRLAVCAALTGQVLAYD